MRPLLTALGLAATAAVTGAANCPGVTNEHPLYTAPPQLVATVGNGSKYTVGPASMGPNITVVNVFGSSYDMGYAYGQLLKNELNSMMPALEAYGIQQINESIPHLSPQQQEWIYEHGIMGALNLTWYATRDHIPEHYNQRIQGIADASGLDWGLIMRIALLPELLKMSCSMAGAFGEATAEAGGGLVQLRALDWTTNGPFQRWPLIVNYHPQEGNGHSYTVVGWVGLVGAITGWSSAGVGISEKVWLHYEGIENVFGYPATMLLEDILHFDMDTDAALSRIASANRTCSFFIGIGDNFNQEFRVVEYGYEEVNIYNWRNFPNYTNHDTFKDLVFVNKHTQPSDDPCMNDLFHEAYGEITAEFLARNVTGQQQTGDMQVAVYDFSSSMMWVSNAAPVQPDGSVVYAYERPMVEVDMEAWWSMTDASDRYTPRQ